ncbi:uncharacterized protein LOC130939448 [Arachis stenosperma]|uniref:uncharacterized protein LOC130939448 n=1 Tax=Arachis stenosperma TaxID=217475 RepID=UPI0025AD5734|nr:uncharacterized protein LOC130939448 [Arachis stenosperma]
MTNRLAFEALDRTLRDIMSSVSVVNKDLPFGGKIIVLGGDFRQVLPVVPKASRAEIVMATINSSILWKHFEVLTLTKNMRLDSALEEAVVEELRSFSDWILQIGEGKSGVIINEKLCVEVPTDLLIDTSDNPVEDIINVDRAILAPTVEIVEEINNYIVNLLPGEEKEYLSADIICGSDAYGDIDYIVDISLLKLIQDELGLNYFDGLDDVSYGIEDNEMYQNMKSSGVQRIQTNTSNGTTVKKRCVAEHYSKRLTEYDMKADRFYIRCEFARLLLKSGGSEQWKFTVKGSKITKTFAMHVLKSKGKNREYKIGPKWKDFVKMHKLRPGYLCVFRSVSNKNHLVQVSVVRN